MYLAGIALPLVAAIEAAPQMLAELSRLSLDSPGQAVVIFTVFALSLVVLAMIAGIDVVRRGRDTLRAERFPPPGMPVLRDMLVIRGTAAQLIGVLGYTLGTILVVSALALGGLSYRIATVLWFGCPRATLSHPVR